MIRHLAYSCLFAREHNISGDEKSSDHAKPRQNRRVQFSYYKHQSLPGANGTIFRGKQRSRRLCKVTQTKSNPNFCYWRQGLRCSLGSLFTDFSFWENVCTAHHYPKESFRTEETGYRRRIYQSGIHLNEALRDSFFCGLRSTETQKKLLTEEHNRGCSPERRPRRRSCRKGSRKKVQLLLTKSTLVIVEVFSLPNVVRVLASEASSIPLVATLKTPRSVWAAEKQGNHVLSVNTETTHVILAVKLATSRRHAKGNLRKCTS